MTPAAAPFLELAIALAIGLIVGLERGWHGREQPEGGRVAGLRTFGLVGFAGGLFALLARESNIAFLIAGFALVGAALLLGQWRRMREDSDVGATTMVAAFITFALGALAVYGQPAIAAAGAVVTALLLGLKPRLHALIAGLEEQELMAALRLLLISVVVLPLLPDRGFGPYEALNPYEIWWFVVLLSGLSFLGYIAVKALGTGRGLMLTAAAGGLFASTAVAISFARLAHEKRATLDASGRRVIVAGMLLAAAIMPLRLLVLVAVVRGDLIGPLLVPMLAMGLTGMATAWYLARGMERPNTPALVVDNPVHVAAALRFAALLAFIMVLVPAVRDWLGGAGLYLLALISGVADVDAITLSTARLVGGEITAAIAVATILIAVAANTVAKVGWVALIAGGRIAVGFGLASTAMLALAALAFIAGRIS
jgi:uncharacterized membrane protein (DUF4010 family)